MATQTAVSTEVKGTEIDFAGINFAELIEENLGGEPLTASLLDVVKVPSGGGTTWVCDKNPELEKKTLDVVIVGHRTTRAYWSQAMGTGGSTAPDCSSPDAKTGYGDPGGVCSNCPMSQFGSAENGRGKACKETKELYVITPDMSTIFPILIRVPAMSQKSCLKHQFKITNAGKKFYHVVSKLSLVKKKNKDGIAYSEVAFDIGNDVDDPAKFSSYAASINSLLINASNAKPVTPDEEAPF